MRWCAAVLLVAIAPILFGNAHICMWSPMQRGNFSIGEPGYEGCYQKVGPCGSAPAGPATTLTGGQSFLVQFQQNLNHYYVPNPGYMDVSLALVPNPQESDFKSIGTPIQDYNAMNEITQTNFSIQVQVPTVGETVHGVLRVRYVSNNPLENDRGEIFYQCADVSIYSGSPSPAEPNPAQPPAPAIGTPCCSPKQWEARFTRVGSGAPVRGYIAYDAVNQYMRVDTAIGSGQGSTIYDGDFRMFMNFSNGMEYYYNVNQNSCGLYGLDYWNDWCYGTGESEKYFGPVTLGDMQADEWNNGDFYFVNEVKSCLPLILARTDGDTTIYYNVTAGISDPTVFEAPSVCLHQHDADGESMVSAQQTTAEAFEDRMQWIHSVALNLLK